MIYRHGTPLTVALDFSVGGNPYLFRFTKQGNLVYDGDSAISQPGASNAKMGTIGGLSPAVYPSAQQYKDEALTGVIAAHIHYEITAVGTTPAIQVFWAPMDYDPTADRVYRTLPYSGPGPHSATTSQSFFFDPDGGPLPLSGNVGCGLWIAIAASTGTIKLFPSLLLAQRPLEYGGLPAQWP